MHLKFEKRELSLWYFTIVEQEWFILPNLSVWGHFSIMKV